MKSYINLKTIAKFYFIVKNANFELLTEEQIVNIDEHVKKWSYFFDSQTSGPLSRMTMVAEKMITSVGQYGVKSIEEKLYFFIKSIDPDFLFLEAYETANTIDEEKELFKINFHFYDPYIIKFEKQLYKRLNKEELLWARGRIKTKNTDSK